MLATELGILQNLLSMVNLTGEQWLICIGVALTLLVVVMFVSAAWTGLA